MSFFSKIWKLIRHPTGFVGRDLEGNMFFERHNPLPEARRTKRTVKYRNPDDMWLYIGGPKRLPVQWSAWLSHTRPDPPTIQELQTDLARQERVSRNAALIEARDREEHLRMSYPGAIPSQTAQPLDTRSGQSQSPSEHGETEKSASWPPSVAAREEIAKPLPTMPSQDKYEPESWTPRPRLRGQ
ncbi:uncharacterized protein BT62DRAFT_929777 [Guyanagaster necrorhizus]|uniref:NADH dehydrogenase [ubiquinone] 1 alpha subcomplex subunit n=1 Tax=Guyanagaster necrorhizus TaxID=856835 RepID=A0A9P8AV28_9AGAR|nr:uncharacterized protein BT62DRAFT_929777 [Guyanagaster necrorhizus MCA 3950]KAG7448686.1 hypothetical protein BT62DRAFT_929777 [Guyanagaster necrorhizus MCA 3950]